MIISIFIVGVNIIFSETCILNSLTKTYKINYFKILSKKIFTLF